MRSVWFSVVATAWVVSALTTVAQQRPAVSGRPPVDPAAHDRGRAIWARECIDCHGSQARGSEKGPNIIRTKTVNYDRSSETPGSVLGPFLKAGHPTMSGKASASFTPDEVVGLAHFLRQRVNDTMRGSPLFTVGDIVVGDRAAGEAFFNGAGKCVTLPHVDDAQSRRHRQQSSRSGGHPAAHDVSGHRAARPGRRPGTRTRTRSPSRSRRRAGRRSPACSWSRAISSSRSAWPTARSAPCAATPGMKVVAHQSAAGAHRSARRHHRHRDARSRRLSGVAEMRTAHFDSRFAGPGGGPGRAAAGADGPADPRSPRHRRGRPTTATTPADDSARSAKITDSNVKHLSLAWLYDLPASGGGTVKGHAAHGRRRVVCHDAGSRVCDRGPDRASVVALHVDTQPRRHSHRQPRRRDPRRHDLLRHARLQPRRARYQDGPGALVQGVLRARDDVLRVGRARGREGPTDCRRERRRSRRARVSRRPQPRERRPDLALVRDAAGRRRSRSRDVAEPRHGQARRRHDVAADHLRSRAEPHLRHDRQSAARRGVQEPRRRQSLHGLGGRAQRGHGQDGVVLPDVSARHARLGFHAAARALRRHVRRHSRASCWASPPATVTFSCSTAPTAERSCPPNT